MFEEFIHTQRQASKGDFANRRRPQSWWNPTNILLIGLFFTIMAGAAATLIIVGAPEESATFRHRNK